LEWCNVTWWTLDQSWNTRVWILWLLHVSIILEKSLLKNIFNKGREGSGGRALGHGGATITGSMTVEKCVASCSIAGYSLAGVEYAGECCKCQRHILNDS